MNKFCYMLNLHVVGSGKVCFSWAIVGVKKSVWKTSVEIKVQKSLRMRGIDFDKSFKFNTAVGVVFHLLLDTFFFWEFRWRLLEIRISFETLQYNLLLKCYIYGFWSVLHENIYVFEIRVLKPLKFKNHCFRHALTRVAHGIKFG